MGSGFYFQGDTGEEVRVHTVGVGNMWGQLNGVKGMSTYPVEKVAIVAILTVNRWGGREESSHKQETKDRSRATFHRMA
jgi:hypothetical protein